MLGIKVKLGLLVLKGDFRDYNQSGTPLALAPRISFSIGASYETPIANWLMLGLTTDVKYVSAYWAQDLKAPGSRQEGYAKLNASIRLFTNRTARFAPGHTRSRSSSSQCTWLTSSAICTRCASRKRGSRRSRSGRT